MVQPTSKPGPLLSVVIPELEEERTRCLEIARKTFADSEHFKATGLSADNFVFSFDKGLFDGKLTPLFEIYTISEIPTRYFGLIENAIRDVRKKTDFSVYYQLEFMSDPDSCKLKLYPEKPGRD